jgi:hypothetical protein
MAGIVFWEGLKLTAKDAKGAKDGKGRGGDF